MADFVDLSPASLDVSGVRAGDRNAFVLTLTENGEPVDLSDPRIVRSQVRSSPTDAEALDAVVTVLDAAAGKVEVRFPGEDVRTLLGGSSNWRGVWDLEIVDAGLDAVTLVAGKWSAVADVTRAAA